jgi:hypothetical protein
MTRRELLESCDRETGTMVGAGDRIIRAELRACWALVDAVAKAREQGNSYPTRRDLYKAHQAYKDGQDE